MALFTYKLTFLLSSMFYVITASSYRVLYQVREGFKKIKLKKLAFDQKGGGGGGLGKNQLANFIFYFSTNNEYSI